MLSNQKAFSAIERLQSNSGDRYGTVLKPVNSEYTLQAQTMEYKTEDRKLQQKSGSFVFILKTAECRQHSEKDSERRLVSFLPNISSLLFCASVS